jgi:SlyX protein
MRYGMSQAQIDALQIKVSFQEELLEALNQQLVQQQLTLLDVQRQMQLMAEQLRGLRAQASAGTSLSAEEKPPHY